VGFVVSACMVRGCGLRGTVYRKWEVHEGGVYHQCRA